MPLSVRLYIFRHGETDWNLVRRIQGHTDVGLNERGRQQAYDLARKLESHPIEALLTSDLVRARDTAQIVANRLGIPLFVDARLREASLGDAEGLTVDEVIRRFGESAWSTWCSNEPRDWTFRFPNGEPKQQTLRRANAGLSDFLETHSFRNVAISTHGGVIRTLVSSITPSGPVAIHNCSVHILERSDDPAGADWRHSIFEAPAGEPDLPSPEF